MTKYVDGFVLAVPTEKLAAYRKLARLAAKVWKDHGALDYVECVGDDMSPGFGYPFPKLARAKADETVVFSWIAYRSRAHRDKVNAAVMADPRMQAVCGAGAGREMPFNPKRMSWGGFKVLVKS